VIMMTAYTSTRSAIEAMKAGAYDYVPSRSTSTSSRSSSTGRSRRHGSPRRMSTSAAELAERYAFKNIIGRSPRMQTIFGLTRGWRAPPRPC